MKILLQSIALSIVGVLHALDATTTRQIQELVASNPFQLSIAEYTYLAELIEQCAPCNVLIFGLGNDSSLWHQINAQGKTVFIEHNPQWYERILSQNPHLTSYFVRYHTKLRDWKILLDRDPIGLAIALPSEVMETKWDLIFVDAPEGNEESKPGRMQSIYMASILGQKGHSHVLVHDCNRPAEQAYCSRFLNHGQLIRSIEKLRHYKLEAESSLYP
jgi:glucuronoxylan 4-O-methyltransferase